MFLCSPCITDYRMNASTSTWGYIFCEMFLFCLNFLVTVIAIWNCLFKVVIFAFVEHIFRIDLRNFSLNSVFCDVSSSATYEAYQFYTLLLCSKSHIPEYNLLWKWAFELAPFLRLLL